MIPSDKELCKKLQIPYRAFDLTDRERRMVMRRGFGKKRLALYLADPVAGFPMLKRPAGKDGRVNMRTMTHGARENAVRERGRCPAVTRDGTRCTNALSQYPGVDGQMCGTHASVLRRKGEVVR